MECINFFVIIFFLLLFYMEAFLFLSLLFLFYKITSCAVRQVKTSSFCFVSTMKKRLSSSRQLLVVFLSLLLCVILILSSSSVYCSSTTTILFPSCEIFFFIFAASLVSFQQLSIYIFLLLFYFIFNNASVYFLLLFLVKYLFLSPSVSLFVSSFLLCVLCFCCDGRNLDVMKKWKQTFFIYFLLLENWLWWKAFTEDELSSLLFFVILLRYSLFLSLLAQSKNFYTNHTKMLLHF